MQNLLEEQIEKPNNSIDSAVEWIHYMTQDEDIDKSFRLAAALQYVENPNMDTIKVLKNDMKIRKAKIKRTTKN